MGGKVFDSSNGKTIEFPVGGVIPGFTTALLNMKVGAEWIVYIPWNQAYGAQESGPIPPYSALTFKVKLVGVKNAPAAPQMGAQMPEGQEMPRTSSAIKRCNDPLFGTIAQL